MPSSRGAALALASAVALGAPEVVRMTERTLRLAERADLEAILAVESLAQAATHESPTSAEGWSAFR